MMTALKILLLAAVMFGAVQLMTALVTRYLPVAAAGYVFGGAICLIGSALVVVLLARKVVPRGD